MYPIRDPAHHVQRFSAFDVCRVFTEDFAADYMHRHRSCLRLMQSRHGTRPATGHTERPVQVPPCVGMRYAFSGEMLFITASPPTLRSTVLGTFVDSG
jgi:hypothetical protein